MKKDHVYTVVEAETARNRKDIFAIWERNYSNTFHDKYIWMYENKSNPSPFTWFITTAEGSKVGFAAISSRIMKIGEQILRAGQTIDLSVDKEHRTLRPALLLQREMTARFQQKGIKFLYCFPNKLSEGLQKRAGFKELGPFERWTKPLRSEYKLRDHIPNKLVRKGISFVADIALRILSKEFKFKKLRGLKTEIKESFDKRFNLLWDTASLQHPIIGERNAAYLDWRFHQFPNLAYKIFCLSNHQNELQGYIIYNLKNGFVSISDFLAVNTTLLDSLFTEFIKKMRLTDATSITVNYFGTPIITERLKKYGFFKRLQEDKILIYFSNKDFPSLNILDRNLWYLTPADRDI